MPGYEHISASLKEVTILSTLIRLLLAAVFGGVIGMERGRRRQAAGLRTHMLVCIGAALVMITNQYLIREYGGVDPARLGAQVISGIGFLGVGTIIVDRQQQVRGLTTAAGLWASSCMGLALGAGFYSGAIIACAFILATITALNKFEYHIISRSRIMEVYAEFEDHHAINPFLKLLASSGIKVIQLEITPPRDKEAKEHAGAIITLRLPKRNLHVDVLDAMNSIDGLITIEELR